MSRLEGDVLARSTALRRESEHPLSSSRGGRMKKSGFSLLVAALVAMGVVAAPQVSSAQVEVNVGVRIPLPPLPRFVFPAPPVLIVVPETYMYVAPDVDIDVVFYQGYWYRPHSGRWYRASGYDGPWIVLAEKQVPHAFKKLPPGFRSVKPEVERIPYQQVKKNWKQWEKERHWDARRSRHDADGRSDQPGHHGDDGRGKGKGKSRDK